MPRIAVLVVLLLAGVMCAESAPRLVNVKDAYKVHQRYVIREHDGTQYVLGEFYEVEPGSFVAQCDPALDNRKQAFFSDEARARAYVLECR